MKKKCISIKHQEAINNCQFDCFVVLLFTKVVLLWIQKFVSIGLKLVLSSTVMSLRLTGLYSGACFTFILRLVHQLTRKKYVAIQGLFFSLNKWQIQFTNSFLIHKMIQFFSIKAWLVEENHVGDRVDPTAITEGDKI